MTPRSSQRCAPLPTYPMTRTITSKATPNKNIQIDTPANLEGETCATKNIKPNAKSILAD